MTLGLDTGVRKTKRKTINIGIRKTLNVILIDDIIKLNGIFKYE